MFSDRAVGILIRSYPLASYCLIAIFTIYYLYLRVKVKDYAQSVKITWTTQDSEEKDFSKLFELGFNWIDSNSISIFYISHSSIAASIFTLGLLCRDLCEEGRTDEALHFSRLLENADDYLSKCRVCSHKCKPKLVGCGRQEEAISTFRKVSDSKTYNLDSIDLNNRTIRVSTLTKATKRNPFDSKLESVIIENYCNNWHLKGQASLVQSDKKPMLGDIYKSLTNGLALQNNLSLSYSQVSLVTTNNQIISKLNETNISVNGENLSIGNLLTLDNDRVSRLHKVSGLNQVGLDYIAAAKSVIYTSIYAALKTIEKNQFRYSEKFLFIDPSESEDKLNDLFEYLATNRDWLTLNELKTHNLAAEVSPGDAVSFVEC